jgi:hypothetical protein
MFRLSHVVKGSGCFEVIPGREALHSLDSPHGTFHIFTQKYGQKYNRFVSWPAPTHNTSDRKFNLLNQIIPP